MLIRFKKDHHRPTNLLLPKLNTSHSETYTFKFDKSCIYTPSNWENDTNKLAGFTLGILPRVVTPNATYPQGDFKLFNKYYLWAQHNDSVRIAWRPEVEQALFAIPGVLAAPLKPTGRIELWLYTYEQGVRKQTFLQVVDVDVEYTVEVSVVNQEIHLVGDINFSYFHNFKSITTGYALDPYMGGDDPSVQDLFYALQRS